MEVDLNTEERIIQAARKIFTTKGMAGARMQDIADEASINKAMLHYYFRSKKKLFEIIFEQQLNKLLAAFSSILSSEESLKNKLKILISKEFEVLSEIPELPLFILHEANLDPGLIERKLKGKPTDLLVSYFDDSVRLAVDAGEIHPVNSKHLLINVISLCIYPFIAKPIFKAILKYNDHSYQTMLEKRPELLSQFIWNSLRMNKISKS